MTSEIRLLLVDGHALIHRAFHALPDLSTSSGELVNAVFGFSSMLLKAIDTERPTHVIMAMDRPTPTFRHDAYAEYKATRPPTPRPLVSQFGRVREVAEAMNIPIYEQDGYEADDILGTLALQAEREGLETVILTGDLDALQLVDARVSVLTPRRGMVDTRIYDTDGVRERYGLDPSQIPDYKALVGDSSDNIPGVKGIGDKTASKLLQAHGSVEGLYDHLDELVEKMRVALEPARERVLQSKRLATIVRTVPVSLSLDGSAWGEIDRDRLIRLFGLLEFRSLIERIQTMMPRPMAATALPGAPAEQLSMFDAREALPNREVARLQSDDATYVATSIAVLEAADPQPLGTVTRIVDDRASLQALVDDLRAAGTFAMDSATAGTDALRATLVGLSFATRPGHAWYVPLAHAEGKQVPLVDVIRALAPVFEDESVRKIAHDLKYGMTVLREHGMTLRGLHLDTMVAAYLANPVGRGLSLDALALVRLNREMTPIESLLGKGKNQVTMDLVDIEAGASHAGEDADVTLQLTELLLADLEVKQLTSLLNDVEMPLVEVLADMERAGIALDTASLAEMSRDMTESLGELEARIYERAGQRFNISSTQQLGQILFVQLQLPSGKRTKSGYSTDIEVLERLKGAHPIVDDILEYRQLIKLKNTYVDALPALINPRTGRVHTDFNQTVAATGRLSSSNPNLQNIPVRGDLGRQIRRSFVPSKAGNLLLAADYSQIELRVLASMSGDDRLLRAFLTNEDIHRATASAVFGVHIDNVTADQRRIAKVVNFGIVYGIGEARLAYETGISRREAGEFIANYNQTYAGVKAFMDSVRLSAYEDGYVTTLLGRRRYVPEIHSANPGLRQAAERAAINMPVQGTAADIIKIAMIRIHKSLVEDWPDARMVLQVHDELVFDVPENDLEPVAQLVRRTMGHAMELQVPLEVEMKQGKDWYEMEALVAEGDDACNDP
ncbi:MAG: DNA polymerase I [Chloroflexota bacterium]|nr:MAG: DNA polymerase I [Chloroflexota bacterium]